MTGRIPSAAPCPTRYELAVLTSGGFEVEAFAADGSYELRRQVDSIEEAAWLCRVPLIQAQASLVGVRP
jgi:hypothetical protein